METIGFPVGGNDDVVVLVEVANPIADDLGGMERAGLGDRLSRTAEMTFDRALGTIGPVVTAVRAQVDDLPDQPDEVELTFGLKLTSTTTAMIVSGSGEAHLNLAMRWSNKG